MRLAGKAQHAGDCYVGMADLLAGPWRQVLNAATMLGQSKTAHQAEIDSACELIDFLRFNVAFASRWFLVFQGALAERGENERIKWGDSECAANRAKHPQLPLFEATANHIYSSGHPAAGSGVVNPFGLLRSKDGGKTWDKLGLEGESDFHVMATDWNGSGRPVAE